MVAIEYILVKAIILILFSLSHKDIFHLADRLETRKTSQSLCVLYMETCLHSLTRQYLHENNHPEYCGEQKEVVNVFPYLNWLCWVNVFFTSTGCAGSMFFLPQLAVLGCVKDYE